MLKLSEILLNDLLIVNASKTHVVSTDFHFNDSMNTIQNNCVLANIIYMHIYNENVTKDQ